MSARPDSKTHSTAAAKRTTATLTCRHEPCLNKESTGSNEITGADRRRAVWLSSSIVMHRECWEAMRQRIDTMIADAVAAGTHTLDPPQSGPENPFRRAARLAAGCDFSRALAEREHQQEQTR